MYNIPEIVWQVIARMVLSRGSLLDYYTLLTILKYLSKETVINEYVSQSDLRTYLWFWARLDTGLPLIIKNGLLDGTLSDTFHPDKLVNMCSKHITKKF
jgi:hypothetical protein